MPVRPVKPPEGVEPHLTYPFDPRNVRLGTAWYYKRKNNVPPVVGCRCPDDLPGYETHCGHDYSTRDGRDRSFPILAPCDGFAKYVPAKTKGGYEMVTLIHDTKTPDGLVIWSRFLHLNPKGAHISTRGERVERGDVLGQSGKSGTSGIHLHWGVGIGGGPTKKPRVYIDPYDRADYLMKRRIPPLTPQYPQPYQKVPKLAFGPCTLFIGNGW